MTGHKRIVLGITGGIAAYKSATIASQLTQLGFDVRVIMTKAATQFITPLTFQTLTRNHVAIDTFDEHDPTVVQHIDLADHADLVVIAPATANVIAKMAHGLADDMLTTTLLATRARIVLAPAMNVHMYENPMVQENIAKLQQRGVHILEPATGPLACGYQGQGRMAEPEEIIDWILRYFQVQPLQCKKVLITAGPTVEPIDPVRFFSNYSSGKMGFALAEAASQQGAEVTLISGPVTLKPPTGVRRIDVQQAEEMYQEVMQHLPQVDWIILAAAVADYRPQETFSQKMKKTKETVEVTLVRNLDIALEVGKRKREDQLFVGFAAETEKVKEHAMEKLKRKRMDLIIANDVSRKDIGFQSDSNIVTVYDEKGEVLTLPKMSKKEIADRIMALLGEYRL